MIHFNNLNMKLVFFGLLVFMNGPDAINESNVQKHVV